MSAAVATNTRQLVNELQEQVVGAYDTPYMVEYYEYYAALSPVHDDIEVWWKLIQQQLKISGKKKIVVLEVGAGDGRVIGGLLKYKPENAEENLTAVEFIGLDIAEDMLAVARKLDLDTSKLGGLTWVSGDACDLTSLPILKDVKVDFMFFAYSSIGLLAEPGQVEAFLSGTHKVLDPKSGTLCLSLLDKNNKDDYSDVMFTEELPDTPIASDPQLFVRERTHSLEILDGVVVRTTQILVIRRDPTTDKDVVVENNHHVHKYRLFNVESLDAHGRLAGLKMVDSLHHGTQSYISLRPL